MPMDPDELGQRWIEALRSGRYKPIIGHLRRGDCYCPFGVLCDLYYPANAWVPVERRYEVAPTPEYQAWSIAGSTSLPPAEVVAVLGIEARHVTEITTLNDVREEPFTVIADRISEMLKDIRLAQEASA